MKDIAIYGFGGFGRELATIISAINDSNPSWNLLGFFDDGFPAGIENRYGNTLGGFDALNNWPKELNVVFGIGSGSTIQKLLSKITNPNISFPNIIAPNVFFFDKDSFIAGKGNVITYGCRISTDVAIGDFNILNGCVSLGHDVNMGSYNVLFPESRVSGMVKIGDNNFFGAKSFVMQGVNIPNNVRLSAGSILLNSPKSDFTYLGNPARKIRL